MLLNVWYIFVVCVHVLVTLCGTYKCVSLWHVYAYVPGIHFILHSTMRKMFVEIRNCVNPYHP